MADLSLIHVGDTLKIPVEVTHADDAMGAPVRVVGDFMRTVVDGKEEIWISRELVDYLIWGGLILIVVLLIWGRNHG